MSDYPIVRSTSQVAPVDRIVVGGHDITYYRSRTIPIPVPAYQLKVPLGCGPSNLVIPRFDANWETYEPWMREGARVFYQRVWPDGSKVTDYRGEVIAVRNDGGVLTLEVGGFPDARSSLKWRPRAPFRGKADVGAWVYEFCNAVGIPMTPRGGPDVGVLVGNRGQMWESDFLALMQQFSQDENGIQRVLMPVVWGKPTMAFEPVDTTTKHCTLYLDKTRVVASLVKDAVASPTTWYGEGTSPGPISVRWRNVRVPGIIQGPAPDYVMAGGASFGIGTTNADTIDGDGIETLVSRLQFAGYLPYDADNTTYTNLVARAVKEVQDDAGLSRTGIVNGATWNALFDLDVAGYDTAGAHVAPLVQDSRVRKFNETPTGFRNGRNSDYDATVLPRDRFTDYGAGVEKGDAIALARGERNRTAALKNWVGTITLNGIGAIRGEHNLGDPQISDDDVMPARDIRPGMNVWVPQFDGGTLFHIAAVDVDPSSPGRVTLTVDTQARDLLEVAAINDRDKEASLDIRRDKLANRSAKSSDNFVTTDEYSGILQRNVVVEGDTWNVFAVPMGQVGSVGRILMHTFNDQAAWCMAVFNHKFTAAQLHRKVGNPFLLNSKGESVWEQGGTVVEEWLENGTLQYAYGDSKRPCGYFPRNHTSDADKTTDAPITGKFADKASWDYASESDSMAVLWVAVWPDRDTTFKRGRVFLKAEDDAT